MEREAGDKCPKELTVPWSKKKEYNRLRCEELHKHRVSEAVAPGLARGLAGIW